MTKRELNDAQFYLLFKFYEYDLGIPNSDFEIDISEKKTLMNVNKLVDIGFLKSSLINGVLTFVITKAGSDYVFSTEALK